LNVPQSQTFFKMVDTSRVSPLLLSVLAAAAPTAAQFPAIAHGTMMDKRSGQMQQQ